MNDSQKKIFRIIISLILAIIYSGIIFFSLILFFFGVGLFGWSDGGDPKELKRLEIMTNITLVLSILIALVTGVYIFRKMKNSRREV